MGATQSLSNPKPAGLYIDRLGVCSMCALCGGLSFALLNLCSFFKGVDDSVLPAVYLEVSTTLGIGPQELGILTMIGTFTVGIASPVSGWLGTRYSRPHLIGYGCFVWSVGAAGMGACNEYLRHSPLAVHLATGQGLTDGLCFAACALANSQGAAE
jgi:MFS family permease